MSLLIFTVLVSYSIDFCLSFPLSVLLTYMTRKGSFSIHKIRSLEFLASLKHSKMAFQIAIKMAYAQLNFPVAPSQKFL